MKIILYDSFNTTISLELWPKGRDVELCIMETKSNPSVTTEIARIFVKHSELERAVQGVEANYDDPVVTSMDGSL